MARIHTHRSRLAGSDDVLIRASFDRAVPKVGGLWLVVRVTRQTGYTSPWEEHGELAHFPEARAELFRAAQDARIGSDFGV